MILKNYCADHKVVFLIDSKSEIHAKGKNHMIREERLSIKEIHNLRKAVFFRWIPLHIGITGNEIGWRRRKQYCNLQ